MKKAAFVALFALSSPVFAQGFVGIGFGQASADLSADPIPGTTLSVEDSDTSFKIFGGTMLNQNFGIEVGYADFGELSITYSDATDYVKGALEGSAIYAAAIGLLPINEQAGLFVKAGLARWDLDATITSSIPGAADSASESGTDPVFGIGAQLAANNLILRAEFERFTDIGDENTTGQEDVDVIGVSAALKF